MRPKRNPVLRSNLKYPMPIMYMRYEEEAHYTLDEEIWPMTLDYDPRLNLHDNLHFEDFEFFSVVEDRADQQLDLFFGLGIVPPPPYEAHSLGEAGQANPIEWMHAAGLTDHKVAAVYLGINDGRSGVDTARRIKRHRLPAPHVQFGSYDLGPVA